MIFSAEFKGFRASNINFHNNTVKNKFKNKRRLAKNMTIRIKERKLRKVDTLNLPRKTNGDESVILHLYGDGTVACKSWYAKITKGKEGLKLDTNDQWTLDRLLRGEGMSPANGRKIVEIDDAGIGFPLGGVWCGVYDTEEGRTYFGEVSVSYFQGKGWKFKKYQSQYRARVIEILEQIETTPSDTLIHICPGPINSRAKNYLRNQGYTVELTIIEDPLQTELEEYVRQRIWEMTGEDIYFDPKGMEKEEIAKRWKKAIDYAKKNRLRHLAKAGIWKKKQR